MAKLTTSDGAEDDNFGYSVAASGDTVVVGAVTDSGSTYVFSRNHGGPDNWGRVQELTATVSIEAGDYFGWAVAISGDTAVVGAYGDDDRGDNAGAAYVFERNQGGVDSWGLVEKLTASVGVTGDRFGSAVAISGDIILIGASRTDLPCSYTDAGSAYIFERNQGGPDNWGQVAQLTAGDAAADDYFGDSVAISGDTAVVGATYGNSVVADSGSAYVFVRNQGGADQWGQLQELNADDPALDDYFGHSVAISGDTVVVGAYGVGSNAGAAYVFERNQDGAEQWGQVEKLTAGDATTGDHFGRSLTVSGDTIVVGAPFADAGASATGSAYVFERNQDGAERWGQVEKLTGDDLESWDGFGWSVAISGNVVAAGSPYDDDAGSGSGSVYLFARRGAAWTQQQKPSAGDAAASDFFGTSVAVSADTFIAGAPGDDDAGAAYLFERNEDGADLWGQVRKKPGSGGAGADFGASVAIDVDTAVVGAPGANRAFIFERNENGAEQWGYVKGLSDTTGADFGASVAISGDTAVVGAPYDNVGCSNCGAAYVYVRNYDPVNPSTPLSDTWGLMAVLTATVIPEDGDQFGWAVAISGDTVVVGARHDTHSGKAQAGSVYVFKRNYDWNNPAVPKADNWGLVRNLTASDAAAGDWFGQAVAISGDTFVVGAPYDDFAGSAYVFERNHGWNDGWGQVEKLTANDAASGDVFGQSVGIDGDAVVVGAPYENEGGDGAGSAYLFARNEGGPDNWGQVQKLIASDAAEDDAFGWAVSISGNNVVIGSPYDDDAGIASGSTYVYRLKAARVYLPLVLKNSP